MNQLCLFSTEQEIDFCTEKDQQFLFQKMIDEQGKYQSRKNNDNFFTTDFVLKGSCDHRAKQINGIGRISNETERFGNRRRRCEVVFKAGSKQHNQTAQGSVNDMVNHFVVGDLDEEKEKTANCQQKQKQPFVQLICNEPE